MGFVRPWKSLERELDFLSKAVEFFRAASGKPQPEIPLNDVLQRAEDVIHLNTNE